MSDSVLLACFVPLFAYLAIALVRWAAMQRVASVEEPRAELPRAVARRRGR